MVFQKDFFEKVNFKKNLQTTKSMPNYQACKELKLLNFLNSAEYKDATPASNFQPIRLLDPDCGFKFTLLTANSADPDQLASSATLFAKTGYIQVQQD